MSRLEPRDKFCIIGAGASGLAVAKNFIERDIPFDCLERAPDLGGLWNIATDSGIVYETTHLISSISSTSFDDLPMLDEDYPEYPSHERVLGYFRDYAARFGIGEHIEFGKTVTRAAPRGDELWDVAIAGEAAPAHLPRRRDRERAPRHPAHADLSRHVRRRDHPLAPLQEPQAGARQARAGRRLRQLGGRYRVGCRARRLEGVPEHPARLLVRAEIPDGLADRRRRAEPRAAAAAEADQAMAVSGRPVGAAGAALALPHARPGLLHRPGASDHDGRDPAAGGARQPHHQAGRRAPRGRGGRLQGRQPRGDRHDRACHGLSAGGAVRRRGPAVRGGRAAAPAAQRVSP